MEKYLSVKSEFYSKKMMGLVIAMYAMLFLTVFSVFLEGISSISEGKNLSGEYAPLAPGEVLLLLLPVAMGAAMACFVWRLHREKVCGDRAPRLAQFMAMSTNEIVPVHIIAEILRVKKEKAAPLLREMLKRGYIRNAELSADESSVRILAYRRIYVYTVYCKNCGAEYTQTSEDDMICQYCGHGTVRKD